MRFANQKFPMRLGFGWRRPRSGRFCPGTADCDGLELAERPFLERGILVWIRGQHRVDKGLPVEPESGKVLRSVRDAMVGPIDDPGQPTLVRIVDDVIRKDVAVNESE